VCGGAQANFNKSGKRKPDLNPLVKNSSVKSLTMKQRKLPLYNKPLTTLTHTSVKRTYDHCLAVVLEAEPGL